MRTTSGKLNPTLLKKKLSTNDTSTSKSISNQSNDNKDRLSQLKQKLQQQREIMKKSGRRFKENGLGLNGSEQKNQIEIQIINFDQQKKNTGISTQNNFKIKSTTGVSTNTSNNLFDFNSIKMQVENKTNKLFMKKPVNKNNQAIYTAQKLLTPNQIISRDLKLQQKQQLQPNKYTQRKKDTINLMQLSTVIQKSSNQVKNDVKQKKSITSQPKFVQITKKSENYFDQQILSNSRVFESAIKEQKKRNKQIQDFLAIVQLQQFAESFINLGYDEIETLIQVQVDDLNQMMMRAFQQDKLMKLIRKYKDSNQIQTEQNKPLVERPSTIHSHIRYRPKSAALTTQPSENYQTPQSSRLLGQSTLINKSSIFYSIGASEWSLEYQIRRACSGCFKVTQQTVKRGECFYCQICDPGEFDLDFISLDQSMIRDFKK